MTNTESAQKFDEKILYKTHQHWIIPLMGTIKYIFILALPITILTYFLSSYSWLWTTGVFVLVTGLAAWYDHFLWEHSWLYIGNQKVTLSVRNGLFSQYAMNVRYRNVRDCAVSKKSFLSFFFKYGTLFIRSSANEGDFRANFVPKVGKVYALVNALSRYSDDERANIKSIEDLHNYHKTKEATHEAHETFHTKHH